MHRNCPISTDAVAAFDALATGVALLDADLHFVYANPAFISITGLARWRGCPLDVLGRPAAPLLSAIGCMRVDASTLTLREMDGLACQPGQRVDVTLDHWPADGVLLELHAGSPGEDANAPKLSQTLRGLAHEVNNPLAGVRGAAQLLKRRLADAELVRLADLIINEADRLGALTARLLHPGGKPHLRAVNLHEVCERARELVAAEGARSCIERDYDPSLPNLRGDADRLLQILLNLLRNAMQAHARRIVIRTRAEHAGLPGNPSVRLAARVEVIDDGDGVPEALRSSLFLPLVPGRPGGTGLGLALAREIAQEHGGQLVHQARAEGTAFILTLPLEAST